MRTAASESLSSSSRFVTMRGRIGRFRQRRADHHRSLPRKPERRMASGGRTSGKPGIGYRTADVTSIPGLLAQAGTSGSREFRDGVSLMARRRRDAL